MPELKVYITKYESLEYENSIVLGGFKCQILIK